MIDFCNVLIAFLEKEWRGVSEDGGKSGAQVTIADSACQQRHGRDPRLRGGSG